MRILLLLFIPSLLFSQSGSLISEDFTSYDGTSSTSPAGWYFNSHGNYTSTTYSGASGPNAYRLGIDQAEIISPAFQNADSLRFWLKGAGTDSLSYLVLLESSDSISWNVMDTILPIPLSATVVHFPIDNASKHLKFIYRKSVGNCSLDDLEIFAIPNNPLGKIIAYFNTPVDTILGFPPHALHVNQGLDDTLIAYINRSQSSLDIAVYNFNQSGNISSIVNAVNNAFARGVQIRWIYNGSSTNSGIALLNPAIQTLVSPTTSTYGLMHQKFMIIDALDIDPSKAFVWTGSMNWEDQQINTDHNNVIIVQDLQLAKAYTREFNQMWGGSGPIPDITRSRFGPTKFENNIHYFIIGGRVVELYFSPAVSVESPLIRTINSADNTLFFGVYAFTRIPVASAINNRVPAVGNYVLGIMDQFSVPYDADDTLNTVIPGQVLFHNASHLFHHKYLIIDPWDTLSDPTVITGSYNWTTAAETKNDENVLIIHDPFITIQFYESFHEDLEQLGIGIGWQESPADEFIRVFPNPATEMIYIESSSKLHTLKVLDLSGRAIMHLAGESTNFSIDISSLPPGIYILGISTEKGWQYNKITISR
ncbi:MAG: T9SS type A sorting domain-containing protein [Bacteroidia bacterium]|nr:T9SS type A sorting domain-containing protein [Bacteroidia bacterium]